MRSEFDDRGPADVGENDVERAIDLRQGSARGFETLCHVVQRCVAMRGLDGCGLDVDGDHLRRAQAEGAQPEHAAAAADVEDAFTAAGPLQHLLDEQPSGDMCAVAEASESELDQAG